MRRQADSRSTTDTSFRVLIVCDHASAKFGGEAILPLHYFRLLRNRGIEVWLVSHARTRAELTDLFPGEKRIVYVEDSLLHTTLWRLGQWLPDRLAYVTTGFISRLAVQRVQRRIVRRLVASEGIDLIHQPTPVSPREPSIIFDVGAPVIIGPMNGGMDYPPAFRHGEGLASRAFLRLGRFPVRGAGLPQLPAHWAARLAGRARSDCPLRQSSLVYGPDALEKALSMTDLVVKIAADQRCTFRFRTSGFWSMKSARR